jgi:hypothetical protein
MPVTAKLSREFYEKFGDKIADELVNWFNQVDATYRSEFKDLFEVHFSRFDAKLEQRIAESDTKWERRSAELDVKWERRMAELRISLIRWMVTLWTVGTLTVLGTALAILKLNP